MSTLRYWINIGELKFKYTISHGSSLGNHFPLKSITQDDGCGETLEEGML